MNLYIATFSLGVVLTSGIWYLVESKASMQRERDEAKAVAEQEKRNGEITAEHVRDIQTLHLHYQHNPVRVFVRSKEGTPTCPDVRAEDIVLTVGGIKRGDGAKAP